MLFIHPAGVNEILLINKLAHEIWPVAYKAILLPEQMDYMLNLIYSPSSLEKQITDQHHKFIIVFDDETPVGFASYSPKENSDDIFRLHKIYILPNQQGKGVGKFLLNYIIEDIKPKGASILELNVNRYNVAKDFYEKFGFVVTGEVDIDIGNGYFMNDYVMAKTLS